MASVHCSSLYPGTRSTLSSALHTLPHTLHFTAIHTDYAAFHDIQARAPHLPPRSTLCFTHHTLLLPTQITLLFMIPRHALHTYLRAPHFTSHTTLYCYPHSLRCFSWCPGTRSTLTSALLTFLPSARCTLLLWYPGTRSTLYSTLFCYPQGLERTRTSQTSHLTLASICSTLSLNLVGLQTRACACTPYLTIISGPAVHRPHVCELPRSGRPCSITANHGKHPHPKLNHYWRACRSQTSRVWELHRSVRPCFPNQDSKLGNTPPWVMWHDGPWVMWLDAPWVMWHNLHFMTICLGSSRAMLLLVAINWPTFYTNWPQSPVQTGLFPVQTGHKLLYKLAGSLYKLATSSSTNWPTSCTNWPTSCTNWPQATVQTGLLPAQTDLLPVQTGHKLLYKLATSSCANWHIPCTNWPTSCTNWPHAPVQTGLLPVYDIYMAYFLYMTYFLYIYLHGLLPVHLFTWPTSCTWFLSAGLQLSDLTLISYTHLVDPAPACGHR